MTNILPWLIEAAQAADEAEHVTTITLEKRGLLIQAHLDPRNPLAKRHALPEAEYLVHFEELAGLHLSPLTAAVRRVNKVVSLAVDDLRRDEDKAGEDRGR